MVDALNAFAGKQKNKSIELNKVHEVVQGLLPWYKNIDERFSTKNVEAFTCSANMGAIVFEPPRSLGIALKHIFSYCLSQLYTQ